MKNNISCDTHDYFEIVCMRRSQVKVTAKSNKKYSGIATDIKLVNKQEYLLISDDINTQQIQLSEVKQLEAIGIALLNIIFRLHGNFKLTFRY